MAKNRQSRLADEIRDLLALFLTSGKLHDPLLANVTITAVKLSPDLQLASVYYRVFEDKDVKQAGRSLTKAAGLLRHELSQNLDVRRVPQLRFFYDESIERASRIESLLEKIR